MIVRLHLFASTCRAKQDVALRPIRKEIAQLGNGGDAMSRRHSVRRNVRNGGRAVQLTLVLRFRRGHMVPMGVSQIDTVVFDLDGTLVDTAPDLIAALNYSLKILKRPAVEPTSVRPLVGHGARALLDAGLRQSGKAPEDLIAEAIPVFLEHYAGNICTHSAPYPGIEAALKELKAEGYKLAICTNKPEGLAIRLVESLGWEKMFGGVIGGDTLPVRKPDPLPLLTAIAEARGNKAIYIGDSAIDVATARAAAMPSIAVGFGYSDICASQLGADLYINHSDMLPSAVRIIVEPNSSAVDFPKFLLDQAPAVL